MLPLSPVLLAKQEKEALAHCRDWQARRRQLRVGLCRHQRLPLVPLLVLLVLVLVRVPVLVAVVVAVVAVVWDKARSKQPELSRRLRRRHRLAVRHSSPPR